MSDESTGETTTESDGPARLGSLSQGIEAWEAAAKELADDGDAEQDAGEQDAASNLANPGADAEAEEPSDGEESSSEEKEPEEKRLSARERLAELTRAAREAKAAREKQQQEKSQTESLKSEIESLRQELANERKQFQQEQELFRKDPAEWYAKRGKNPAEILDRMIRSGTDKTGLKLEDKIGQLEAQNKQLIERLEKFESGTKEQQERSQQEAAERALSEAKTSFVRHVMSNTNDYKALSTYDEAQIAEWAVHVAQQHAAAESVKPEHLRKNLTLGYIASTLEEYLREDLESRYTKIRGASPEQAGEKKRPQKRDRGGTLTNAQAAQRTPTDESRPLTNSELIEKAERAFIETYRSADS